MDTVPVLFQNLLFEFFPHRLRSADNVTTTTFAKKFDFVFTDHTNFWGSWARAPVSHPSVTHQSPISPDVTIEIFAFIEAADESKRMSGIPVTLASEIEKAKGVR